MQLRKRTSAPQTDPPQQAVSAVIHRSQKTLILLSPALALFGRGVLSHYRGGSIFPRRRLDAADDDPEQAGAGSEGSDELTFVLLCAAATVTKLAASVDDVVWLVPFISGPRATKIRHSMLYVIIFLCLTVLASLLTQGFAFVVGLFVSKDAEESGWSLERIMGLTSAVLLLTYTLKLLYEYIQEMRESSEDSEGEAKVSNAEENGVSQDAAGSSVTAAEVTVELPPKSEDAKPSDDDAADVGPRTARQLLTVAVLGGLDDVCVQASLLISGTFEVWHMLIGVFCGCCVVLSICWGASAMRIVVRLMEKIPLWFIVGVLGIYTLITALVA